MQYCFCKLRYLLGEISVTSRHIQTRVGLPKNHVLRKVLIQYSTGSPPLNPTLEIKQITSPDNTNVFLPELSKLYGLLGSISVLGSRANAGARRDILTWLSIVCCEDNRRAMISFALASYYWQLIRHNIFSGLVFHQKWDVKLQWYPVLNPQQDILPFLYILEIMKT